MKRIPFFLILFIFSVSSVQALNWAYPFVVWKGKLYEVKQEMILKDDEIGKMIGKVKTKPNDMTGKYYGNASNHYPIGTKYYEIIGTSPTIAIAVQDEQQWVKAVYVDKAPAHIMNLITHPLFISFIVILVVIGSILFRRKKMMKEY